MADRGPDGPARSHGPPRCAPFRRDADATHVDLYDNDESVIPAVPELTDFLDKLRGGGRDPLTGARRNERRSATRWEV
ncbi:MULTISPECIES: hypothetical protein [unclassified Streptomyces]|uniref:hypothetical protein n=1 Tax=unclassified Streptomyces TaxID=2593676 RepID=UPI002E1633EC|nr:hypothetical protein OIE76_01995 [Streptomyces sp. NBC_01727]